MKKRKLLYLVAIVDRTHIGSATASFGDFNEEEKTRAIYFVGGPAMVSLEMVTVD